MNDVDQVAAIKAQLELMGQENEEVLEQVSGLLEQLSEMELMDPAEKHAKFKELSKAGAFQVNNVDVRRLVTAGKMKLSPPRFMARTRRRLANTSALLEEFIKRGKLELAETLQEQLSQLNDSIVDENDAKAVTAFRSQVETLRSSDRFQSYVEQRNTLITEDPEIKVEAEIMATKESLADNEEAFQERGDRITEISEMMERGEISPEEAESQLGELEMDAGEMDEME